MSSLKYRPDIDGLRAVAIIPVLLFHLGYSWIPGGFLGVDVFFVISGYLISSIILKECGAGSFSFKQFWVRRIRRIFPVLSAMLIVTLVTAYFFTFRPSLVDHAKIALAAVFSFANVSIWRMAGDYWGPAAESSPLLHTWSLSVEEQFYFFYPVALFLLLKFRFKWIVSLFVIVFLVSFWVFLWGAERYPDAAFYLLPTRVWELTLGCILSVIHYRKSPELNQKTQSILSVVGLLMVCTSFFIVSGNTGISWMVLFSVLGTGMIILNRDGDNFTKTILSNPVVVFLGKISYSLYIWHWPVIVLARPYYEARGEEFPNLLYILIIFAVSVLSYYGIEKTTRKMKHILFYSVVSLSMTLAICATFLMGFLPTDYDTSGFEKMGAHGRSYDITPNLTSNESGNRKLPGHPIIAPDDWIITKDTYRQGGIIKGPNGKKPEIMLLGDSHALMWARAFDEICSDLELKISINTIPGVAPFFEIPLNESPPPMQRISSQQLYEYNKSIYDSLGKWKPKLLVMTTVWQARKIEQAIDIVEYARQLGIEVLLIEQPPMVYVGDKDITQYCAYLGLDKNDKERQYLEQGFVHQNQRGRQLIRDLAARYSHVSIVEIADIFLNKEGLVWVMDGKEVLYRDDDHLNHAGALRAKDRLGKAIAGYFQDKGI
jgi:peptidoglycan/LPS O-acetylase OafA/YrhL